MSWKDLLPVSKFSIIGFIAALIIGLMSMGLQGYAVYYLVGFVLPVSIDSIHGDAMWPSTILAGMAWAIGFLIAGSICRKVRAQSTFTIWILYVMILWAWAYLVWWAIIGLKVVQ